MEFRRPASAILAAAALAAPLPAAPVTRGQLAAMARDKVDPAVMRSIVERDCVDFDVDAENAAELSKVVPSGVLEAAIECRKHAASDRSGAASVAPPAAASLPETPAAAAPGASAASAAGRPLAANLPPSPASSAGEAQLRVRAVFIGESGTLRCSCSLDGRPIATLTKEAQGEFGQAVERSKIRRESAYVSAGAGRHAIAFVCDPGAQAVKADIDLAAGERLTVEVAESALRHWKLRKVEKN